MPPVVIDFAKLAEIGIKGIRRAAVFMGLGLNAANNPDFRNYQLSTIQNLPATALRMELIPSNVNNDTLAHFKTEFATWVIGNALREMIERFAIFLDNVHYTCQLVACSKNQLEAVEATERDKEFRFKGVAFKLRNLEARFSIKPNYPAFINSINQARNCLTHRTGRVGAEDCNVDQGLEVKWVGMDFQVELKSGTVMPYAEIIGVPLPEDGVFQVKFVERSKLFPTGGSVYFQMHELAEISNFMLTSITAVTDSALKYAKSLGIAIQTV